MDKSPYDIEVNDRKTFIKFLNLLLEDFRINKNSWENNELGRFLEAMSGYANDIDVYYENKYHL